MYNKKRKIMCNVTCNLQTISIALIDKLLKTKKEEEFTSIREIINLDSDIIIPEEFNLGVISSKSLKGFLKVKSVLYQSQKEIPIRELEALRDGWFLEDHWIKDESTSYLLLDNPGIRIDYKEEQKIRDIFSYLHKLKEKAKEKNIDSRIDEAIKEFRQLEVIFFSCPNLKLFPDNFKPDLSKKFSCVLSFQLDVEKLSPKIDVTDSYINGKETSKKKKRLLFISDYLFLKTMMTKVMDLADFIDG